MEKHKIIVTPVGARIGHSSILMIGSCKEIIINIAQLLESKNQKINIVDALPIKADDKDYLEADLIVMVVDASNRHSLESVAQSFPHVPLDYFQGHILMVVHKPLSFIDVCVDYERLSMLADEYICPVLWDFITNKSEQVASQILQKLKVANWSMELPPFLLTGNLREHDGT